jgi:hypothetical protein
MIHKIAKIDYPVHSNIELSSFEVLENRSEFLKFFSDDIAKSYCPKLIQIIKKN